MFKNFLIIDSRIRLFISRFVDSIKTVLYISFLGEILQKEKRIKSVFGKLLSIPEEVIKK